MPIKNQIIESALVFFVSSVNNALLGWNFEKYFSLLSKNIFRASFSWEPFFHLQEDIYRRNPKVFLKLYSGHPGVPLQLGSVVQQGQCFGNRIVWEKKQDILEKGI